MRYSSNALKSLGFPLQVPSTISLLILARCPVVIVPRSSTPKKEFYWKMNFNWWYGYHRDHGTWVTHRSHSSAPFKVELLPRRSSINYTNTHTSSNMSRCLSTVLCVPFTGKLDGGTLSNDTQVCRYVVLVSSACEPELT